MTVPKTSDSSRFTAPKSVDEFIEMAVRLKWWWIGPLVLALVVCVGLGIWLLPRRTVEFASVDGQHRWDRDEAPPRRTIVWQAAVPATPRAAAARAKDSVIRPQLADDGNTLYFTLRAADGGKDIYRSRLVGGAWRSAEPVAELNTEADDIGPVIQADGNVLYLYSNRAGGYGGFDLYVSLRSADGWSDPVNLGPKVNSPANEYDPAITSDGRELYFASNRSPRMHRLITAGKYKDRADQWSTTLRADVGLNKFDIYRSARPTADASWSTAGPVIELNRDDSNEGTPFVSPDDGFLYFVSDRPQRPGEETNLDIFRARIRGPITALENLGTGVNTPQNELEPALSPEGFRIYFSRNTADDEFAHQYALFSSTAVEVEECPAWDDDNWQAFASGIGNFISDNWWWAVLTLLALAALAGLIWCLREVSLKRATVPTFFVAAILLHILLGLSSYLITFGDGIFEDVRKKINEVVYAEELPIPDPSNLPEQEAFNEISEQLSIDTVDTPKVPRQTTEPQNVPLPTEKALPSITQSKPLQSEVSRQRPDDPQVQPHTVSDPLLRRQQLLDSATAAQVPLETTEGEQSTQRQVRPESINVPRRQLNPQVANAPPMRRRTIDPVVELAEAKIDAERPDSRPAETTPAEPRKLDRKPLAEAEIVDAPDAAPEQLAQAEAPTERKATTQSVAVPRTQTQTQPATDATLPRRIMQTDAARLVTDDATVEPIKTNQPSPDTTAQSQANLDRKAPAEAEIVDAPDAAPEQLAQAEAPTERKATTQSVAVPRTQTQTQPATDATLPRRIIQTDAARLVTDDATVEPIKTNQPSPDTTAQSQANLDRKAPAEAEIVDAPDAAPEQLAQAEAPTERKATTQSVAVPRTQTQTQPATDATLPRRIMQTDAARLVTDDATVEPIKTNQPSPDTTAQSQAKLDRKAPAEAEIVDAPDAAPEQLAQAEAPTERKATTQSVAVPRTQTQTQPATDATLPRRIIQTDAARLVTDDATVEPIKTNQPSPDTTAQSQANLDRKAPAEAEIVDAPDAAPEQLAQADAPTERKATTQSVAVPRTQTQTQPATDATLPRRIIQTDAARLTTDDATVEPIKTNQPSPDTTAQSQANLDRKAPAEAEIVDAPDAAPEQLAQADAPTERKATTQSVAVPRTQTQTQPATDATLPRRIIQTDAARLTNDDATVEPIKTNQPSPDTTAQSQPNLDRTVAAKLLPDSTEIVTETVGAPVSSDPAKVLPVGRPSVAVARQEIGEVGAAPAASPDRPLARSSGRPVSLEVTAERVATDQPSPDTTARSQPNLDRSAAAELHPDAAGIVTEAVVAPVASEPTKVQPVGRPAVAVARQEIGEVGAPPAASPDSPPVRSSVRAIALDIAAERIPTTSSGIPQAADIDAQLARAQTALGTLRDPGSVEINTESVVAIRGPSTDKPATESVGVTVPRQTDATAGISTNLAPVSRAGTAVGPPQRSSVVDLSRVSSKLVGDIRGSAVAAKLTKTKSIESQAVIDAIETEAVAGVGKPSTDRQVAGVHVGVSRDENISLALNLVSSDQLGGPHRTGDSRLSLGQLSREKVDTALATNPRGARSLLRPARPRPALLFAEDNIGLQALLRMRKLDEPAKKDLIKAFGGDDQRTLDAIHSGLKWLATQQHEDGRWRFNEFKEVNGKMASGPGNVNCDVGATGFALVPFLGNGNTHRDGVYKNVVANGIRWLIANQQASGELTQGNEANARMYGHGIATIALCETYALTRDASLREPAQRAINFIVAAQDKTKGGWRYVPGKDSDTSVVGWQVMALKSAQMGDLDVPKATLDNARRFLQSVSGNGNDVGRFGYTTSKDLKNAMTAEGLLCMQYLGAQRDDSVLQMGAQYLLKNLPQKGKDDSYYWYYGTQVMFHMEGDYWKQWNDAFSPLLLDTQHKDGHMAGTWDPTDNWEKSGGRIFATSLRVLMLEAFFRHLPLYRVLDD